MASVTDIRLVVEFRNHPKRIKLHRRLGAAGVLALVDLWMWAGGNRPHGNLDGMTDEDIEIAAGWDGAIGAFVATLRDLRFLDEMQLHGWEEHQGWASGATARSEAARVAGMASAVKRSFNARSTPVQRPLNESATPVERIVNEGATPLLSSPSLSSPSLSLPEKKLPSRNGVAQDAVETLYAAYPRKAGKTPGMKIARREIKTPADLADLERAIGNYAASRAGQDPQFTLHFGTFMGRWRDYLAPDAAEVPRNGYRGPRSNDPDLLVHPGDIAKLKELQG